MTDRPSPFAAELSALLASMPGVHASSVEQADWFYRKADLLERVATDDPGCDQAEVRELARVARARADELRRGWYR